MAELGELSNLVREAVEFVGVQDEPRHEDELGERGRESAQFAPGDLEEVEGAEFVEIGREGAVV